MNCWTVYILYSTTLNRHYIGCTGDLPSRVQKHLHKSYGADAFTAKANDWEILLTLPCKNESQAKKIEKHIKSMKSRVYIHNLIQYQEMQEKLIMLYAS